MDGSYSTRFSVVEHHASEKFQRIVLEKNFRLFTSKLVLIHTLPVPSAESRNPYYLQKKSANLLVPQEFLFTVTKNGCLAFTRKYAQDKQKHRIQMWSVPVPLFSKLRTPKRHWDRKNRTLLLFCFAISFRRYPSRTKCKLCIRRGTWARNQLTNYNGLLKVQ